VHQKDVAHLHGFFNEEGGQQKDVAHPTWLHGYMAENSDSNHFYRT